MLYSTVWYFIMLYHIIWYYHITLYYIIYIILYYRKDVRNMCSSEWLQARHCRKSRSSMMSSRGVAWCNLDSWIEFSWSSTLMMDMWDVPWILIGFFFHLSVYILYSIMWCYIPCNKHIKPVDHQFFQRFPPRLCQLRSFDLLLDTTLQLAGVP